MASWKDVVGFLAGITSSVQTQINAKAPSLAAYALTYAASLTVDPTLGYVFNITLTGNITLGISAGADGQIVRIRYQQDGTGTRTLTHDSTIDAGLLTTTLSITASKVDTLEYQYHAGLGKWLVTLVDKGY